MVRTHMRQQHALTINAFLAFKIICLDGAVDRIKSHFESQDIVRGPDYIVGDLDSISADAIKWLNCKVQGFVKKCRFDFTIVVWIRFVCGCQRFEPGHDRF